MFTPIFVQITNALKQPAASDRKLKNFSAKLECGGLGLKCWKQILFLIECAIGSKDSIVCMQLTQNLLRWFINVRCIIAASLGGKLFVKVLRWVSALSLSLLAVLHISSSSIRAEVKFMRVYGHAAPPEGYVEFCRKHDDECISQGLQTARLDVSPQLLSELDEVNRLVNNAITPATDAEIYGVEEYWTFPQSAGDCEDYVILKRRILMQRGWPASALLITVVIDEHGDGHAVLTARTTYGDFILDNQTEDIKLWTTTPYRYVMRQSFINPKVWMFLAPQVARPLRIISGLRAKPAAAVAFQRHDR